MPSVSQGLVACGKCSYALYRTSAQTSARKISYYRVSVRRARPCEAIAHRRRLDGGRASKCPSTIGGHEGDCRMAGRQRMRRRWSQEEKRRIVAQTLMPGASVSQVARRYDVNTNLVFTWRRDTRLRPAVVPESEPTFLPVEVVSSPVSDAA